MYFIVIQSKTAMINNNGPSLGLQKKQEKLIGVRSALSANSKTASKNTLINQPCF